MAFAAHWKDTDTGERREDARRVLRLEAEGMTAGGERAEVLVHNISEGGLLIETGAALEVGEEIDIDLPQAGTTRAVARWQSARLFGCEFAAAISPAALSAAQLRAIPVEREPLSPAHAVPDAGFAARLQRLRKARGLTLAQVAGALGVSKPTVWAWEQGRSRPVDSRLTPLLDVLGVDAGELFPQPENAGALEGLLSRVREEIAAAAATTPERVRIMIEL